MPGLAATELGIAADTCGTKTCRQCGRTLPLTSFNRSHKSKDGHQHICKDCARAACMANLAKAHAVLSAKAEGRPYIGRPGVKRTLTLADFTDEQLAAEFGRRGYAGTITKTSSLSI